MALREVHCYFLQLEIGDATAYQLSVTAESSSPYVASDDRKESDPSVSGISGYQYFSRIRGVFSSLAVALVTPYSLTSSFRA